MKVNCTLKEFRQSFNYTQLELSYLVGCDVKTIYRIENGYSLPSLYIALKLAKVFGCSLHDLFYIA